MLNTRPVEQSAELSRLLRAAGFDVVEAPAIAIVEAWDAATLAEVREQAHGNRFSWVVLPSQNAGHGLEAELRASGEQVICGAATARGLGLDRARVLARFSAAAALDVLQPLVRPGERVLIPRAAEGRDELVDGLRALDVEVAAPVAYRTVPTPDASDRLREGDIDVVTLCSPSAARSVAAAVSAQALVVCLGQTTAAEARTRGLRVDGVAARPSMAALLEATQAAVGARV